jgi:hypothetical protein
LSSADQATFKSLLNSGKETQANPRPMSRENEKEKAKVTRKDLIKMSETVSSKMTQESLGGHTISFSSIVTPLENKK